ncbi:ABC transporter permease [Bacillus sp. 03113]|uniref:ABC transporter permease n=1 Tax=Bacillus sp. 03113 TaxID=2578211 RepID=UPI001142ED08|nr:ABC transporter permease [Bacillus sp. 03113]
MFNDKNLWKERVNRTRKELGSYLRYILNGHFVIVVVFLLGTASFYYQAWIKTLSANFPAAILLAFLLAFLMTYSPVYTFFVEADLIFLLPLEHKLTSYIRRSLFISFILQAYVVMIGLAVMMPIYAQVNEAKFSPFFYFLFILFLVKWLNLFIRWHIQYYVDIRVHRIDIAVRYCLNFSLLYLLFSNAHLVFIIGLIGLLAVLSLYFKNKSMHKGLKWEFLIEAESRRLNAFYRLANLFTDVPKLRDRVKRRKWLDGFIQWITYQQYNTYLHLYVRSFFRAGDYFGLFLRLTVIGIAALYFISFGAGQVLFVILFMYLTGFQLLPLWRHYDNKVWIELYPIEKTIKEKSFKKLLSFLLVIQAFVLSCVLLFKGDVLLSVISLLSGAVFTYVFVYVYLPKKIRS